MILAIARGAHQEGPFGADVQAAQSEHSFAARTQPVELGAGRRATLPYDARGLRAWFREVFHQRRAVESPYTYQRALLTQRDLHGVRSQLDCGRTIHHFDRDRVLLRPFDLGQRSFEHAAVTECAWRNPDQFGAAAIELEIDTIAMGRYREQRRR